MTRGDQADNPEHALPDVHEHAHARKRRSAKKAPAQDRGSGSKKDAYIGVAVAVVALLVTSFFSLRQLENSTEALEQTRDALSVQLLVTTAESTERAVESFASGVGVRAVSKHLPARDQLRLNSTLRTVDRLALLFNREYLVIPGLRRQWRSTMRCLWYVARYQEEAGLQILARDNPSYAPNDPEELQRLVRRTANRSLTGRWPQLLKMTNGEGNLNDCTRARVYTPR